MAVNLDHGVWVSRSSAFRPPSRESFPNRMCLCVGLICRSNSTCCQEIQTSKRFSVSSHQFGGTYRKY
ncbi:hypothetical protein Mapa_004139 [Marchantia paleacea]|nr:hypothetical protein Mapa_004139 [Marchantia paleacea]